MGKKLYVGGLPYSTTDESLHDLFQEVGEVASVRIITDRDTQRSKGFGFVEMATDALAAEAIERFDGKEFGGRRITVNEARPQEPRENNRGPRGPRRENNYR
jgi:RNA recognition motif-containing protein